VAQDRATLRASDAERSAVVAELERHYAAGRLTLAELEERTRQAYAAKTLGELDPLRADLPAEDREPAPPACSAGHGWKLRSQLASFVSTAVFFVAIWALTGRAYFWPAWPLLAWGVGLIAQALRGVGEPRPLKGPRAS
jgi:hypothetical protein